MFELLTEHFDKIGIQDHGPGVDGWRDKFAHADDEGADRREALRIVDCILQLLYLAKIELEIATRILADGSRVEEWRLPFGDEGILDFYLNCLTRVRGGHNEPEWTSDALRLIGNCCADLDANRERVLAKIDLSFLIAKLGSDDQVDLTIAVLCNLCFDYEPAQKAARAHRLFPAIIALIDRKYLSQDLFSRVCQLLELAIDEFDPGLCPDNSVAIFYKAIITRDLEVEDQVSLSKSLVALLKHERFQRLAIVQDDMALCLCLIIYSYTQDQTTVSDLTLLLGPINQKGQENEDEEQLSAMRQSLLGVIWDLSALPEFAVHCPPTSDCIRMFVAWLRASESQRQLCACYVLRNLASSDEASIQMVQHLHVHEPLVELLRTTADVPVVGEVLRLLKNLALPAANRETICSGRGTMDTITTLWSQLFLPTLQHAAASLVRLLLKGCIPNIHLFLRGYSTDQDLEDTAWGQLSRLFALFETSKDQATKVETARILIEIWRTIHLQDQESEAYNLIPWNMVVQAEKIHANVAAPVVWMIMEAGNPSLVTEGWFGLTLIASSSEGGETVSRAIWGDGAPDGALALLRRTTGGQDLESKDRANALVLVDRLLQHEYGNPSLDAILQPLLKNSTKFGVDNTVESTTQEVKQP